MIKIEILKGVISYEIFKKQIQIYRYDLPHCFGFSDSPFKIVFPYLFFAVLILGVIWSNIRTGPSQELPISATEKRIVDPVCQMDVNIKWNINYEYEGATFHFCSHRCESLFTKNPEDYIGLRCMVCKKPLDSQISIPATYMDRTYYLCSQQHRQEFKTDPAGFFMHRMWGIPDWLYYVSIGLVLTVSFFLIEGVKFFQKKRTNTCSDRNIAPDQTSLWLLKQPMEMRVSAM